MTRAGLALVAMLFLATLLQGLGPGDHIAFGLASRTRPARYS